MGRKNTRKRKYKEEANRKIQEEKDKEWKKRIMEKIQEAELKEIDIRIDRIKIKKKRGNWDDTKKPNVHKAVQEINK